MTEINPRSIKASAEQIARNLDKKDGREDGKISASIWNQYAKTTGGNTIKNCITLENAIKSIMTYIKRGTETVSGSTKTEDDEKNVVMRGQLDYEQQVSDENLTPEEEYWANRPLNPYRTEKVNKPLSEAEIATRRQAAKEQVNALEEYMKGHSFVMSVPNEDTAAYFVQEFLSRGYKLNSNMHMNVMLPQILKQLLNRASELGIKSQYEGKNLDKVHFDELAQAIKDLANQIIEIEKNGSHPAIWADEVDFT